MGTLPMMVYFTSGWYIPPRDNPIQGTYPGLDYLTPAFSSKYPGSGRLLQNEGNKNIGHLAHFQDWWYTLGGAHTAPLTFGFVYFLERSIFGIDLSYTLLGRQGYSCQGSSPISGFDPSKNSEILESNLAAILGKSTYLDPTQSWGNCMNLIQFPGPILP